MFKISIVSKENSNRAWGCEVETQKEVDDFLDRHAKKGRVDGDEYSISIEDISNSPEVLKAKRRKNLPSIADFMEAILDENPEKLNALKAKWKQDNL
jgi:hypothetical protein